jgi:hypothetical protein
VELDVLARLKLGVAPVGRREHRMGELLQLVEIGAGEAMHGDPVGDALQRSYVKIIESVRLAAERLRAAP